MGALENDIDGAIEDLEIMEHNWSDNSETCENARISVINNRSSFEFHINGSTFEYRLGVINAVDKSNISYQGIILPQKKVAEVFSGLARIIKDIEGNAESNLFACSMKEQLILLKSDIQRRSANQILLADHEILKELIIVLEDSLPLLKKFEGAMYQDEMTINDFISYVDLFFKSNKLDGKYLRITNLKVLQRFNYQGRVLFPDIREYRTGNMQSYKFIRSLENYSSLLAC